MSDRITAMDVENVTFSRRMRGFDPDEVLLYLKSVAEEISRLTLEHAEMSEQIGMVRSELQETRKRESTLQETLVSAQRMAEELKEKARAESRLVVKEARFRADQIVRQAQDQLSQIESDITRTRLERDNIERRLRGVIEQHLALIEMREESRGDKSNVRVMPAAGRVGTEVG